MMTGCETTTFLVAVCCVTCEQAGVAFLYFCTRSRGVAGINDEASPLMLLTVELAGGVMSSLELSALK
jgi:hypothetical protein